MKKLPYSLIAICLIAISFTGCSSDNKEKEPPEQEIKDEDVREENDDNKEDDEEAKEKEVENEILFEDATNYEEIHDFMEEETGGVPKVLYGYSDPNKYDFDQIEITLESYEVIELNELNENFVDFFDEKEEGRLVVARFTIHNTSDKELHYRPNFFLEKPEMEYKNDSVSDFLPPDKDLSKMLTFKNDHTILPEETMTGFEVYPLPENLHEESTAKLSIPASLMEEGRNVPIDNSVIRIDISLNKEGEEKIQEEIDFYKDSVSDKDLGEKVLIKEKKNIDKKVDIDNSELTLHGYQITNYTPNASEKQRYSSFQNGIVLLTAEFTIKNKGDRPIQIVTSTLYLDDKKLALLDDPYLDNVPTTLVINNGESKKFYQVFIIEGEGYEAVKNKPFEIEFGPIVYEGDMGPEDWNKNETVEIPLPE